MEIGELVATAGQAAIAGSVNEQCICNCKVPPAPRDFIGTCDYYLWRHWNFLQRHNSCQHRPPDYYIDYGYKYCIKFSLHLHPRLSEDGKSWLSRTRVLLQVYMEQELARNPTVELDNLAFRKMAFRTHPDAYWYAGLRNVPWSDRFKILREPDWQEWTKYDTWAQAADVGWRVIKDGGTSVQQGISQTVDRVTDKVVEEVKDKIIDIIEEKIKQMARDVIDNVLRRFQGPWL